MQHPAWNLLALKRRGQYGLVYFDAHSDFRHPGIAAAIVTGRGDRRLADLEARAPYVRDEDVHLVGIRADDDYHDELAARRIQVTASRQARERPPQPVAEDVLSTVAQGIDGFWIYLDVDIVDAAEMFAVDCPEPDGLSLATLTALLRPLVQSPGCVGMELTIYDPDLDPAGSCAERIVACLAEV